MLWRALTAISIIKSSLLYWLTFDNFSKIFCLFEKLLLFCIVRVHLLTYTFINILFFIWRLLNECFGIFIIANLNGSKVLQVVKVDTFQKTFQVYPFLFDLWNELLSVGSGLCWSPSFYIFLDSLPVPSI